MPRPAKSDLRSVARAQAAASAATTVDELRRAQAILLPAQLGATLAQTAAALGVGRATVARYQRTFRERASRQDAAPAPQWGGRRHCWMTREQEQAFLAPWLEQAKAGGLLVVSPLRAALAAHVGHPVKPSVIYRMLARHGWRKVAPDTRHPKSDPAVQEEWKKNSPKRWQPS